MPGISAMPDHPIYHTHTQTHTHTKINKPWEGYTPQNETMGHIGMLGLCS